MLDIRQLRSDPQGVAANLARRGFALDLEQFTALEARRKEAQVAVDALRNERNTRSKAIGHAKAKGEDIAPAPCRGRDPRHAARELRAGACVTAG
jgi:seryl-tRNA synthetase